MRKVTLLKGLPASGKSTRAKELVMASGGHIKRINKDDMRAMVDDGAWSKKKEEFIVSLRDTAILTALRLGHDVIIDDTNLHEKHELHIRELVKAYGDPVEVIVDDSFCKVPMRECIRRDSLRSNPVGRNIIHRMARQVGLDKAKPYFVEGLQECVICDLDGTLALMGKRNPFDASTCEDDEVNPPVSRLLISYYKDNMPIFYFSGREDKYKQETYRWLSKNGLDFHRDLVMRPSGNNEKDVIVKGRMFEEYIRGKFNVHVVLDDRSQVVDGWRDLGLTCFQVAEGNF